MEIPNSFKVLMVGDGAVGKSTLLQRLSKDEYAPQAITKGLNHIMFETKVENQIITLMIWDLGGQRQFTNLHRTQIKGAKAVIYNFDLSRIETLANVKNWVNLIQENKNCEMIPYLIGNKVDLQNLIDAREQARTNKDWATADKIRDQLKALGIDLQDKKR